MLTSTKNKSFSDYFKGNAFTALMITIGLVLLFRVGSFITIPGISPSYVRLVNSSNLFQLLGLSGSTGVNKYSFFSLGVTPFVTSSIIVQLLGLVNPIKSWSEQGDIGRFKLQRLTRLLAILFGSYQVYQTFVTTGSTISLSGMDQYAPGTSIFSFIVMGIVMLTGTFVLGFISDKITEKGLGQGQSVIILSGILANLTTLSTSFAGLTKKQMVIMIGSILLTTIVAILLNYLVVKLPVVTSNGGKTESDYLILKVNPVGMVPIIFAGVVVSLPVLIGTVWDNDSIKKVIDVMSLSTASGIAIYGVLIVLFSLLYVTVQMKPKDMSLRMDRSLQHFTDVIPGEPTVVYLTKMLRLLGGFSGCIIAILAMIPLVMSLWLNIIGSNNIGLLGSSMIIVVSTLGDMMSRYDNLVAEEQLIESR